MSSMSSTLPYRHIHIFFPESSCTVLLARYAALWTFLSLQNRHGILIPNQCLIYKGTFSFAVPFRSSPSLIPKFHLSYHPLLLLSPPSIHHYSDPIILGNRIKKSSDNTLLLLLFLSPIANHHIDTRQ